MTYAFLADGRDQAQMRELDTLLAPDDDAKAAIRERANMEEMERFKAGMAGMQTGKRR